MCLSMCVGGYIHSLAIYIGRLFQMIQIPHLTDIASIIDLSVGEGHVTSDTK